MDFGALAIGVSVGVVSLAAGSVSKKYMDKAFGHETVTLKHLSKKDVTNLDRAAGKAEKDSEQSEE
jgi:hypothetical protein